MKQLLISTDRRETRAAVLEDGRVSELYVERVGRRSLVGNIYKGRVENVLSGMDAAFVDIGLERNGFLFTDEMPVPDLGPRGSHKITDLLRAGAVLPIQVTRDPLGNKGARLTAQLGLAGRYAVYTPNSSVCGVSRRLDHDERERLRDLCRAIRPETGGFIVRTAAEGAGEEELRRDLRFLQLVWARVERRLEAVAAPGLVHTEVDLAIKLMRDVLSVEFQSVLIDDRRTMKRAGSFLRTTAPTLVDRLTEYRGPVPLFEAFGVDADIRQALGRVVHLPSGGYLVIDDAEALTVVDVNSGRYVGRRSLRDTALRTNLEACREVVRQLRLRDTGGIVVIDFIDMPSKDDRDQLVATLEAELARDRTKTYVVELSPLGLVEMTRQGMTVGLRRAMMRPCPTCGGQGSVLSDESAAIEVERRMRRLCVSSDAEAFLVEVHPRVASFLRHGEADRGRAGESRLKEMERETGRRFILRAGDGDTPLSSFALLAEGPLRFLPDA